MGTGRHAAQLITDSDGLLLDFDGPVCRIYAGRDPARIARQVAVTFRLEFETSDPLRLVTHAPETGGPVDEIHHALTQAEVEAVHTAAGTPGIRELLESYPDPIAIVSNNATEAIDAWLTQEGLRTAVGTIIGRDPRHMKPDPTSLRLAAEAIGRDLSRCVFVGDSLSDAEAARNAHVAFVALANKPGKRARFERSGCDVIIDGMDELLDPALVTRSRTP
jgi:phosphoglycolate phosphatase